MGEREPKLRFLVIGAHAVGAHGHQRFTHDVDFLVPKSDQTEWVARATGAGLTMFALTDTFAQFRQKSDEDGFDLMFVKNETFEKLWGESVQKAFGSGLAQVPALDHLLALKLHALKQAQPHRTSKDAEDVQMLIRRNNLDISQPKYEQLFLKFATRDIYETIQRTLKY